MELSDETLGILLQLHGEVFPMDNGFWTKFEAYRIESDEHVSAWHPLQPDTA